MKLSVLDLIDLRVGQTVGESLRASRELVCAADRLGFTRYWVAEHHNAEAVVSTTPAVELMYLGEGTSRIRLGSGVFVVIAALMFVWAILVCMVGAFLIAEAYITTFNLPVLGISAIAALGIILILTAIFSGRSKKKTPGTEAAGTTK